jgi:NADPH2:quinone reductase
LATVSTLSKAEIVRAAGADEVFLYDDQNLVQQARRVTEGRGLNVVYDSVGKDTFQQSLDCLARRGFLILYGQSSGLVPPIEPLTLNVKGSLFVTWPSLFDYIETRADLLQRATAVLGWIETKKLELRIHDTLPLSRAAEAHKMLESRMTTGKILLIP